MKIGKREKAAALRQRLLAKRGLERREVEKRIYGGERQRLTASATFHGYRITAVFEQRITDILTKNDEIVNNKSKKTEQPVAEKSCRKSGSFLGNQAFS